MLRLAFDFIITWRETRTRPNAYDFHINKALKMLQTNLKDYFPLFLYFFMKCH